MGFPNEMADINTCEGLQLKITDVRSLILLLSSPEAAISSAAAESLAKYAETCKESCLERDRDTSRDSDALFLSSIEK